MTIDQVKKIKEDYSQKINTLSGGDLQQFALTNREQIATVYQRLFRKKLQGCDSCYMDALIQIATLNTHKLMKKMECLYMLKAGKLLHDVNGDSTKMMSHHNITNELAEYHLRTNTGCEIYFSLLPDDWRTRAGKVEKKTEKPKAPEVKPEPIPVIEPTEGVVDLEKEAKISGVTDPETLTNTLDQKPKPKTKAARKPRKTTKK